MQAVAQKIAADFPDIAIYHCQQGAEKALKGFLILHDNEPGNTHNINTLLQQAAAIKPEWSRQLQQASILSQYNQTYRYPSDPTEDFNPTPGELKKAFRIALDVYSHVLDAMPLEIVGQRERLQQENEQQRSLSEDLEV